jgi:hypothetical protein
MPTNETVTRKCIGSVGVDSGQLIVTDPCYIKDFESDDAFSVRQNLNDDTVLAEGEVLPYSYGGACAATSLPNQGGPLAYSRGHEGAGVAVRTGFGDGFYPVFVEYEDTGFAGVRVKRVVIEFWSDEDEDDAAEDWDAPDGE